MRANQSNVAGAAVDSFVFPTIAFGSFIPQIVILQFAAKVLGGFVWAYVADRLLKPSISQNLEQQQAQT